MSMTGYVNIILKFLKGVSIDLEEKKIALGERPAANSDVGCMKFVK